jgi:hypothetical protein
MKRAVLLLAIAASLAGAGYYLFRPRTITLVLTGIVTTNGSVSSPLSMASASGSRRARSSVSSARTAPENQRSSGC